MLRQAISLDKSPDRAQARWEQCISEPHLAHDKRRFSCFKADVVNRDADERTRLTPKASVGDVSEKNR
jgi:hypothetical protein